MRLVAENLKAERGGEEIFDHLSFTISSGEALVVTGPNGSGKSTLLRIISGLLEPVSGRIRFEGSGGASVQSLCHYLGHQNAMKPTLTVRENLSFWQSFQGTAPIDIDVALEQVGLHGIDHLPFGYLSTGQKRRVSIAKLLTNFKPVWVLDEPTAGLDRASETRFAKLIQEHLSKNGIVIAATHIPLGIDNAKSIDLAIDLGTARLAVAD